MHCSCLLPLLHSPPTSLLQLATLHPPPSQSFADPDSSSLIPIAITVWLISQTQRTIVVTVFSPSSSIQVSVFFAIVQPLLLFLLLLFSLNSSSSFSSSCCSSFVEVFPRLHLRSSASAINPIVVESNRYYMFLLFFPFFSFSSTSSNIVSTFIAT